MWLIYNTHDMINLDLTVKTNCNGANDIDFYLDASAKLTWTLGDTAERDAVYVEIQRLIGTSQIIIDQS